uniref:Secreted protein n=1 Tax=Triticum urartu TaxID=4572 RepID=A0A8R7QCM6_TRIUA
MFPFSVSFCCCCTPFWTFIFYAQDLANCACAELALEYGLQRRRGPQGHRCCGAGRGFRAVHRPPVLPGEGLEMIYSARR